jgi:hypothetical protein
LYIYTDLRFVLYSQIASKYPVGTRASPSHHMTLHSFSTYPTAYFLLPLPPPPRSLAHSDAPAGSLSALARAYHPRLSSDRPPSLLTACALSSLLSSRPSSLGHMQRLVAERSPLLLSRASELSLFVRRTERETAHCFLQLRKAHSFSRSSATLCHHYQ